MPAPAGRVIFSNAFSCFGGSPAEPGKPEVDLYNFTACSPASIADRDIDRRATVRHRLHASAFYRERGIGEPVAEGEERLLVVLFPIAVADEDAFVEMSSVQGAVV